MVVRIGCLVPDKKRHFFKVLQQANDDDVRFSLITSQELLSGASIDVLLHKLSHTMVHASKDPIRQSELDEIEDYLLRHPEILVVDPLDRVKSLIRRDHLYGLLQQHVNVPAYVTAFPDTLIPLDFPSICKHIDACGTVYGRWTHL